MDVTPRELRDIEIREAFRGYNRDEVNDLLERAAATIEALSDRARALGERLTTQQQSGGDTGRGRDTEDMLHRTLLLAQRAADEAIAEAQSKARELVDDAEARSRRMIAEATIEARRTSETEHRRLEQEVKDLQTRRDLLRNDVDGLEHYESDYRSRLVRAIEKDLQAIKDRGVSTPGPRPELSDASSPSNGSDDVDPRTIELDVRAYLDDKARPLIGSGGGPAGGSPASTEPASSSGSPASESAVEAKIATDTDTDASTADTASASASGTIDLFGAEQAAAPTSSLDDDSFFASLRDAVRDDAPLGPRDGDDSALFDQDSKDAPSFRETFKRRR